MSNIRVESPKTVPIALVIAGMLVIGFAIYGYYFGENPNLIVTFLLVVIGIAIVLLAIDVHERDEKRRYLAKTGREM